MKTRRRRRPAEVIEVGPIEIIGEFFDDAHGKPPPAASKIRLKRKKFKEAVIGPIHIIGEFFDDGQAPRIETAHSRPAKKPKKQTRKAQQRKK